MIMLDTNICIYIIKNRPQTVREKFVSFDIGELCISTVTISELYYGACKSQYVEKNLQILEQFLVPFEIVDYGYKASLQYGIVRAELEKSGQVIGGMDMMIAAHALSLNATLVTNNLREFERVKNLRLENWV